MSYCGLSEAPGKRRRHALLAALDRQIRASVRRKATDSGSGEISSNVLNRPALALHRDLFAALDEAREGTVMTDFLCTASPLITMGCLDGIVWPDSPNAAIGLQICMTIGMLIAGSASCSAPALRSQPGCRPTATLRNG
jgi:hypothetical protein